METSDPSLVPPSSVSPPDHPDTLRRGLNPAKVPRCDPSSTSSPSFLQDLPSSSTSESGAVAPTPVSEPDICVQNFSSHSVPSPPASPLEISSALMTELIAGQGQSSIDLGTRALDSVSHDGFDSFLGSESCDGREHGQSSLDVDMTNALKRKKDLDSRPPRGPRR
ncbi:hypothetical protein F511_14991 [Dorcoceras hygrometricum]|uniref:Uncharacterized protein n=1 Tax=Dorcoceras hygrometricum TaxID=472368 RepID=A0A2Z7BA47_9LAMI|nr:hypothetical protein F511_14991 [Dorcoceras hygrometricum]